MSSRPPIVSLRGSSVTFGGRPTFVDVEIGLAPGDKACLVGRNGCGKSTLMKLLAGSIEADAGERFVQPGTRIAYLPQDPPFAPDETVGGFIARGLLPAGAPDDHRALKAAEKWGLDASAEMATLSGGTLRRAALAQATVDDPDVLLLDEPTNHLDLPTIASIERMIADSRAAVLTVSHDRAFLKATSRRMYWLDRGGLRRTDRGFAAFDDWADEIADAEAAEARRMSQQIKAEERYMERGVTARRRRNMRRVERLAALR
ncbi:MAG: ATP-binding cassette domain-containing protein, partial [Pseudomonadota bacterium]